MKKYYRNNKGITIIKLLLLIILSLTIIIFLKVSNGEKQISNYSIVLDRLISDEYKNSEHYINDLYESDGFYYYNVLNDRQRKLYLELIRAYKEIKTEFDIDTGISLKNTVEDFKIVRDVLQFDHPEMLNLLGASAIYNTNSNQSKINVKFKYIDLIQAEVDKKVNEVDNIIKEILNNIGYRTSDYEKEKIVYEWLARNNEYAANKLDQSAYSALKDKYTTVCAGFAKAAQLIFQRVGLNSIPVLGSCDGVSHAWNIVEIEDEYYYFDATASKIKGINQNILLYRGLNFLDTESYSIRYKKYLPKVKGTKYNYFDINNKTVFFKKSDLSNIKKLVQSTKETIVEFRVENCSEFIKELYNNYIYYKQEIEFKEIKYVGDIVIIFKE